MNEPAELIECVFVFRSLSYIFTESNLFYVMIILIIITPTWIMFEYVLNKSVCGLICLRAINGLCPLF